MFDKDRFIHGCMDGVADGPLAIRGKMDETFEKRDLINVAVVRALDEASTNWGVKVLRYEICDLKSVAERYVDAFKEIARKNNTLISPANMGDMGSMIAAALTMVKAAKPIG